MATEFEKFWATPGMMGDVARFGLGAYGAFGGSKEANARVNAAQGPLYQQAMGTSQGMLARANMDPTAAAQQRLNAELGLLREEDAASEAQFMRNLQKRGQLGVSTYDTEGKAIDPKMYAFLKAREQRNARMASDSLDKGEAAITANVNRANTAQGIAANTQQAGMLGANARPSNVNRNVKFLQSGLDFAKKNPGMISGSMDWLKKLTGGGPDPYQFYSGGSGLDSVLDMYSGSGDWWDSVYA